MLAVDDHIIGLPITDGMSDVRHVDRLRPKVPMSEHVRHVAKASMVKIEGHEFDNGRFRREENAVCKSGTMHANKNVGIVCDCYLLRQWYRGEIDDPDSDSS